MIYEYKCNLCNKVIELVQHYTEVGDTPCVCGGILKRYFTPESARCLDSVMGFISKPIIDMETGRLSTYHEIKKKCKLENKIFAPNKEIEPEIQKNRKKMFEKKREELKKELESNLKVA
jgi:hypothetical protein